MVEGYEKVHGRCSAVSRLRTFSDYPLRDEFAVVVSSVAETLDPLAVVRAPRFFGHAERRMTTTRQLVSYEHEQRFRPDDDAVMTIGNDSSEDLDRGVSL